MPDRPTEHARQFSQAAPVLHVGDVQETVAFYRDKLGFNNDYGDTTYAVVWRENAAIHLVRGDGEPLGVDVFFWSRA
jgi:catechol 2,3-dioxygenase-like lactoylglutathione lyase family enzyme